MSSAWAEATDGAAGAGVVSTRMELNLSVKVTVVPDHLLGPALGVVDVVAVAVVGHEVRPSGMSPGTRTSPPPLPPVAAVVSWHDVAPVVTVVLAGARVVTVVPGAGAAPELQAAAAVTQRNPKSTKARFRRGASSWPRS